MSKFEKTLAATKTTSILAVIENLPVSANGFFLTEEQMTNIEASLTAAETTAAALATATHQLATSNGQLATANDRITELEQEVATLGKQDGPGAGAPGGKEEDEFEKKDDVDPMAFGFQKEILDRL